MIWSSHKLSNIGKWVIEDQEETLRFRQKLNQFVAFSHPCPRLDAWSMTRVAQYMIGW
jgi:hypothetical protein